MPVRSSHHVERSKDEVCRYALMKHVAHRIDEYCLGFLPTERKFQSCFVESKRKAIHIISLPHRFESQCHALRVTMLAAWANLRATRERIPGGLGPFNWRL